MVPYNLLKKWSVESNDGGPKMNSNDQQKIADITKKYRHKALYRGTVVSESDFKKGQVEYKIPRLQSWTTNKSTAEGYATNFWANNANKRYKAGKPKVVFVATNTSTRKVKSYILNDPAFANRDAEVIVNRPVFTAYFNEANYDYKKKVHYVPVEFIKSHTNRIVPNTTKQCPVGMFQYAKHCVNRLIFG